MSTKEINKQEDLDYTNDYNYPTLCRKDLMYLSSINSRDFPKRKIKNQITTNRDWSVNLYTLDIDKAYPTKVGKFYQKPDFINKVDDIEKASPRPLKREIIPNFINKSRDIDKAYPMYVDFSSMRCTNPLNPKYKLASCPEFMPPVQPKFLRDSMQIDDIEGTRTNKFQVDNKGRNYFHNKDEGLTMNHPKPPYQRKKFYDNFNYPDLKYKWKSQRSVNPLDPEYGEEYGGRIENSKPFVYGELRNDMFNYLSNKDIIGSNSNSKNRILIYNGMNRNLSVNDIRGAQAGTLRKGITTIRNTNPLEPTYQYPGNSENLRYGSLQVYPNSNNNNKNNNNNTMNTSKILNHPDNNYSNNNQQKGEDKNKKQPTDSEIFEEYMKNGYLQKQQSNLANIKNKNISRSCDNIFIKENTNNIQINMNENNKEERKLNIEEEEDMGLDLDLKPQFNKDNYRKPRPNYELNHHRELQSARLNPERSRLSMMKQQYDYPRSNYEYAKDFVSRLNEETSRGMKNPKEDTLYSQFQNIPPYEKQLEYFLKDNNYEYIKK